MPITDKMQNFVLRVLAVSILVFCNASSSVSVAAEPAIRFHSSDWKLISINDPDVSRAFRLSLSDYRMPDDIPFVFGENALYLRVVTGERTWLVSTDFALSKNCTPNFQLTKLLCAGPESFDVNSLTPDVQAVAIPIFLKHGGSDKDYFIITIGEPEIYALPQNEFIYKTGCRWAAEDRIACHTSHGTGVWTTVIFDLHLKAYPTLPNAGANLWNHGDFDRGYILLQSSGTLGQQLRIYNLANTLLYTTDAISWATTEDAVVVVEVCGDGSTCFHSLQFDGQGIARNALTNLGVALDPVSPAYILKTPAGFVVTTAGRVFFVAGDTLQVTQRLDFPQDERTWFNPDMVIAQQYGHLLIAQSPPAYFEDDLFETDHEVVVFDLDKCRGALDESCIVKAWAGVFRQAGDTNMYLTIRHTFYSRPDNPNLVYVYDEDSGNLTLYNLNTGGENIVQLPAGVIDVFATSADKQFLLVGIKPDDFASSEARHYYLINLNTKGIVPTKIEMNENLFFFRESV